jgi:hypothetical protein
MSKPTTDIPDDYDFGFTTHSADEVEAPAAEVVQSKTSEVEQKYQAIIDNLLKLITPLLNNLQKDADTNEYIKWPDRKKKIDDFKKKLADVAAGKI